MIDVVAVIVLWVGVSVTLVLHWPSRVAREARREVRARRAFGRCSPPARELEGWQR